MSRFGPILKGVSEKFSDRIARIEKYSENNKSLIACSLSRISDTMNDIDRLTSSPTGFDQSGNVKAGNLQDRLTSQEG
jgi:hypothetical protein